jgi:plastocyanin
MLKKFLSRNNSGNQRAILIALIGVALVLVVLVTIDLLKKPTIKSPVANDTPMATDTPIDYEEIVAMTPEEKDEFRAEVPVDTIVPDVNTQLTVEQQKEIALPTVVVPAAPGASSKFRNFKISAEAGAFVPTKVIANVGDTVHIDFTAVDQAYDIVFPSYNMMQTANPGETKILEFQALQEGSFTYYCSACGGPESGPKGNIIIVK